MASVCDCNITLGNTGQPNCFTAFTVAYKLLITPTYQNDGITRNEIDLATAALDQAWLDALINNADDSARLYPLPAMANVENVRGDDIVQTLNNAQNIFVQQGNKPFTAILIKNVPAFLKQLKKHGCTDLSAYILTKSGQLVGNVATAGKLRPIMIDRETWSPKYTETTDTIAPDVMLNFQWAQSECDEDLGALNRSEIDADLLNSKGLVDVTGAIVGAVSTTSFVVDLNTLYGSPKTPIAAKGLLLADFTLEALTVAPGVIAIASSPEAPAGRYTFTYPAQASGEEMKLSITKDGFDSALLESIVITVP